MNFIKIIPGFLLSFAVAAAACLLESLLPVHLVGAAVIALFIGMIMNHFMKLSERLALGVKFTSKKFLSLPSFYWGFP